MAPGVPGALWVRVAVGIAALIAGLQIASRGLRLGDTSRLGHLLGRATDRPVGGVVSGLLATMVVHSSSVATIATVGLVNAGALTLDQATGVVMGANVGTTLTAQILAWRPGPWLPAALAVLGVLLLLGKRTRRSGRVLCGAALVVAGLLGIDGAAVDLGRQPWFAGTTLALSRSPLLGVAAGIILTSLVLSSALTIGILQRLAAQGVMPLLAALPVLFGDNIGTTTDTLLASVACNRDAQRVAVFHLLFNVIGTLVFLPLLPWFAALVSVVSVDPARQIAHAHTLFNVACLLLLFPFRPWLVALTRRLLPDRQ